MTYEELITRSTVRAGDWRDSVMAFAPATKFATSAELQCIVTRLVS